MVVHKDGYLWAFEFLSGPKDTACGHCKMYQKQNGVAFASYASLKKADLKYVFGQGCFLHAIHLKALCESFFRICDSSSERTFSKTLSG